MMNSVFINALPLLHSVYLLRSVTNSLLVAGCCWSRYTAAHRAQAARGKPRPATPLETPPATPMCVFHIWFIAWIVISVFLNHCLCLHQNSVCCILPDTSHCVHSKAFHFLSHHPDNSARCMAHLSIAVLHGAGSAPTVIHHRSL